jgi:hypothetical protein
MIHFRCMCVGDSVLLPNVKPLEVNSYGHDIGTNE